MQENLCEYVRQLWCFGPRFGPFGPHPSFFHQGAGIVGYTHVEFLSHIRSDIHVFALDKNQRTESQFLALIQKLQKSLRITTLHAP